MIDMEKLNVDIFADGANKHDIFELDKNPLIKGFTTNPTLMRKAGVLDYKAFAFDILSSIKYKPISFEVLADDFKEMKRQAKEIASWGENVYVKIPITNTKGESSVKLIKDLSDAKVKINVTAVMTTEQVEEVLPALQNAPACYISIFAGRIANTGRNPITTMKTVLKMLVHYNNKNNIELIWASPRELLNIIQAHEVGCHIITATNDILEKLHLINKDLNEFSLETVRMFYNDAQKAGYKI